MSKIIEYESFGDRYYSGKNGHWHSYYDEPSFILYNYYHYHSDGYWHRDDAPALIFENEIGYYNRGKYYEPKCQKL